MRIANPPFAIIVTVSELSAVTSNLRLVTLPFPSSLKSSTSNVPYPRKEKSTDTVFSTIEFAPATNQSSPARTAAQ